MAIHGNKDHLSGLAGIGVTVLLALAVYAGSIALYQPLSALDLKVFDAQIRANPPAPADPRIVRIDIDDPSIARLGRWPWPRTQFARMITGLSQQGAAAVVLDLMFNTSTEDSEDQALRDSIQTSGKIFYGVAMGIPRKRQEYLDSHAEILPYLSRFAMAFSGTAPRDLFPVTRIEAPLAMLTQEAKGVGHITAFPDSDGVSRRIPLVLDAEGAFYPSLALLVAMDLLGAKGGNFTSYGLVLNGGQEGGSLATIPVDKNGNMIINYAGDWERGFPNYSFAEVLDAFETPDLTNAPDRLDLEGKVCIIACAQTGGTDIGTTSWELATPMAAVVINAINTIVTGRFIRTLHLPFSEAIILFALLILLIAKIHLRPVPFIALTILVLAAYVGFQYVAFRYASLSIPLARPLFVLGLASGVFSYQAAATEHVRRSRLRNALGCYMPDSVVSEILRNPALLSSHSERKEMTILSCSLADFDEFAANLDPEETVQFLQRYYETVSQTIYEHGGTIDTMFQARLLADFGHPIYHSDHPRKAVLAACDAVSAVHALLAQYPRYAGRCDLKVGIETGFATVGSFGAAPNMHYSILGERVAVACRLEEQAEAGEILVTYRTFARVGDLPKTTTERAVEVKSQHLDVCVIRPDLSRCITPENVATVPPAFEHRGPYRIMAKIGQGGMAIVYKGYDDHLDRFVAVKEPLPVCLNDSEYIGRFRHEARIMAKVNHPRIVQIYTVGEESGTPFIAMEYVDGETLNDAVQRKGPLDPMNAVETILETAQGLAAAHAQGIVHLDVKPSNILLTKDGKAKVSDFGLAKVQETVTLLSRVGCIAGTPLFMSPEQAMGMATDHRSDIYSLGVTFYFALTGKPPFSGNTPAEVIGKHVYENLPEFQNDGAAIPPGIYIIIQKMMSKTLDERYATYDELIRDIYGQLAGLRVAREGNTSSPPKVLVNTRTLLGDPGKEKNRS